VRMMFLPSDLGHNYQVGWYIFTTEITFLSYYTKYINHHRKMSNSEHWHKNTHVHTSSISETIYWLVNNLTKICASDF